MTTGYGISGIGNLGLGAPGLYGTYDSYMPSMMGMYGMSPTGMNSVFGMGGMSNMYGMGGMGMMGMYNPMYMSQMQNIAEENQVKHAGNMHTLITNNGVKAYGETDSALIQKITQNGDVQQGVQNLYTKVKSGDQKGICDEFDKLRTYIYNTYSDELKARGEKINPAVTATQIVESVYGNIISAQTGEVADLRSDIEKYGEGPMMNGFMQGFHRGHQNKYIDHTMNHCFGLEIDNKGSQDMRQTVGKCLGRTASVFEKSAYGTVAGVTIGAIGSGIAKLCGKSACLPGWLKWGALIGAGVGALGDIIWQISDSSSSKSAA